MSLLLLKRLAKGALLTPFYVKDWLAFYLIYLLPYLPSLRTYLRTTSKVRLRNGLSINIRPFSLDRFIINEVWIHRDYDITGLAIRAGDTVIDLGAHVGVFSLYAARLNAKVYAVEPCLESYELLLKNRSENQFEARITTINKAIDPTREEVRLHLSAHNPGMNSTITGSGSAVTVPAIRLESLIEEYDIEHCDLLKCDIEGSEYETLYHLPATYYERIDAIYLEFHQLDEDSTHTPEALAEFLKSKGYFVRQYFTYIYADRKSVVQ